MSSRLAKLGAAIGKNVPPPRVDLWGTTENSVKFEIRETAHFMEGPRQPIYGDFLKAFSRTIGRLFNGGNLQANLRFEGTVYSSTLTPVLTYRLYPIDPSTTRSTKATGVDFNGGDIDIIFDVKSQILRYTRPIDIILFIGNTAAYVGPSAQLYLWISGAPQCGTQSNEGFLGLILNVADMTIATSTTLSPQWMTEIAISFL